MTVQAVSTLVALLSLACWFGTVGVLILWAVAARRPGGGAVEWLDAVGAVSLWAAWLVAAVTTMGSLYYSQVAHYLPCELCWFQRICMYPLAVVLLVAAIARDQQVWRYVIGPAVIGIAIAAYHTQLQAYPEQHTFCSTVNPCTTRYVWEFGFVSLPFMALSAFCFIVTMMLIARREAHLLDQGAIDG